MAGKGPLTDYYANQVACPSATLAKMASKLKIDEKDLQPFRDQITKFGESVTPVHMVASTERLDNLKLLVEEGWDVDIESPYGTPLCIALDRGCISVARKLIEYGADSKKMTSMGQTPMCYALCGSKKSKTIISAVKVLYEAGVSLDAPCQKHQGRPLHVAVLNNNSARVVSFLLQMGADGNIGDEFNSTPMHYAAFKNRVEIIALLMKHQVKLDLLDRNGFTPLTIALKEGKVETIAGFIDNGYKINGHKHTGNFTLLQLAVTYQNFEIVEYLVKSGADPNARSASKPNPHTLQLLAVEREFPFAQREKNSLECLKILDYLVEKGANVNCAELCDESPLTISLTNGFLQFAKAIIGHGSKINSQCLSGDYLFHLAVMTNKNIIFTFLEFGGDYNVEDYTGLTPYLLAIERNVDLRYITSFIQMGCPYNQKKALWTDVLKKVYSQEIKQFFEAQQLFFKGLNDNSLESVKTSVEKGAIPTGCSEEMRHPLHFVVSKGYESLAAFLLEHNFPPNGVNNSGKTPLQIAAKKGHLIICSLLLKYGACYNYTSKKCAKTPAELANKSNNENVTNLIQQVSRMFHLAKKKPKVMLRELRNATSEDYLMFVNARNSSGQTLMSVVLQNHKNSIHASAVMALRLECEL